MGPQRKALTPLVEPMVQAQHWLNGWALKHRNGLMLWLVAVMLLAFVLPAAGVSLWLVVPLLLWLIWVPWFRIQRGYVTLMVGPCFKRGGAACEIHMMGVKSPLGLRKALKEDVPHLLAQLHQDGISSVQFRSILLARPEHRDLFVKYLRLALEEQGVPWQVRSQGSTVSDGDTFAFWLMHVAPVALRSQVPDAWKNRPRDQAGKTLCGVVVVG